MVKLDKDKYSIALPHLRKVEFNYLFAQAILEKVYDGDVYVDDTQKPSVFYVSHPYCLSLLFGNTENQVFNEKLRSYLLNENNERGLEEWLQVYPNNWHKTLDKLLKKELARKADTYDLTANEAKVEKVVEYTRLNFKFNKPKYLEFKQKMPVIDCKIVKTDQSLFEQMKGSVVPSAFWKDAGNFAKQGIGYSILVEGELASTAYSAFIHDGQVEVGIETIKKFQGRGIAAISCSAIIDYCIANKLEPVWSCKLENIGSYKLAQKLGFEPSLYHPFYQVKI